MRERLEAGDIKRAFDVPNSCALLRGLAEEEANLLEGLGESKFARHCFEERAGEKRRKKGRFN
jgi:hypothetical protein